MTPRRVELLLERRRAVRASGLTLWQLEKLSLLDVHCREAYTPGQRWLWNHVIYPIGLELGDEGYGDYGGDDDPEWETISE